MIFKHTVLRLTNKADRQGDIISSDAIIDIPDRLPVVLDYQTDADHHLGMATLKRTKNAIKAEIVLLEIKRNRQVMEHIKCGLIYPAVGGIVKKISSAGAAKRLEHIEINIVSLSTSRNTDKKIKPLAIKPKRNNK